MSFHDYSKTKIQRVTPQIYPMDRLMLRSFKQFAAYYLAKYSKRTTGELAKMFDWSPSQYSSFSKLRHFKLIDKFPDKAKGRETNLWYLTTHGREFYLGNETSVDIIVTFDGQILPPEHEAWEYYKGKIPRQKLIQHIDHEIKQHIDWVNERKLALGYVPHELPNLS